MTRQLTQRLPGSLAARCSPAGQADPPSARPAGHVSLDQLLSAIGVAALTGVLAAQVLIPDQLNEASVALAMVGILVGIPHGAVDHMVPFWTSRTRPQRRSMALVLGHYLLVAALAVVALVVIADLAVAIFLLASAWHFGRAETQFLVADAPAPRSTLDQEWVRAAAHGSAVIVLPLGFGHYHQATVLGQLAPAFPGDAVGALLSLLAVGVLSLNAAVALQAFRQGRWRVGFEIVLLVAVFVLVNPLAAFAVYFGFWHALRHTARLLALPGPDGARLATADALRRYARCALLPTAVVAAALPIVWIHASPSLVSGALAVLLALTFPHMRTVAALDRWSGASGRSEPMRIRTGSSG